MPSTLICGKVIILRRLSAEVQIQGREKSLIVHWCDGRAFEIDGAEATLCSKRGQPVQLPAVGQLIWILPASIGKSQVLWGTDIAYQEAKRQVASMPSYKLVLKNGMEWEGKDLSDPKLIELWNPARNHPKNKPATWYISRDDGKSWKETECPDKFCKQFNPRTGRIKHAA